MPASKASCQRDAHRHHWSPGLQAGEAELGVRRRQVVADRRREGEELGRDPGAHGVDAEVLGAGVAAAVPVEAGERVEIAGLECLAEDVLGHGPFDHGRGAAPQPPGSGVPVRGRRRASPSKRSTQAKELTGARLNRRGAATGRPSTTRDATATVSGMPNSARTSSSRRTGMVVMTPPSPSVRAASSRLQTKG